MILLDTHALLWWQAGGERLSSRAAREIAKAEVILLSPISFWEVTTLLSKGRIALDRDPYIWLEELLLDEQIDVTALSARTALAAGLLPDEFPGDPADRMLYATARDLLIPLVSKDMGLSSFARSTKEVRVIW